MDRIFNGLCEIYGERYVYKDELMSLHTTFRVGGPAKYYVTPVNDGQICKTIRLCRNASIDYYIIGRGSNLLVRDKGFDGVIIEIGDKFAEYIVSENQITAHSGIRLKALAAAARDHSLTGLEFAHGIPGTLGGAVAMNAGAYGGEMKQVLVRVKALTPEGEIKVLSADELELGYRKSIITAENYIVLEATVALEPGDREHINSVMVDLMRRRRDRQPLEYPSAGSTFKRPEGYFAGKLIQDAGLAGYRIGGAMVSPKHCGFVINYENAGADDIITLINEVISIVNEKFGVVLEPEVKML